MASPPPPPPPGGASGEERNITIGHPSTIGTNNAVYTGKFNAFTFLPIALREQFRRNGNIYFLCVGILMAIGTYTNIFASAISPVTTLAPLSIVIFASITQEGIADLKRHRSDRETNNFKCIVLKRSENIQPDEKRDSTIMEGKDVDVRLIASLNRRRKTPDPNVGRNASEAGGSPLTTESSNSKNTASVAFVTVKRMDIRAGDIVLIRNREMIPADTIILGSSGESGSSYVETSPIDGETNLKLRNSPQIPVQPGLISTPSNLGSTDGEYEHPKHESIEQAVKRVTRMSLLGYPDGVSALRNPFNPEPFSGPPPSPKRTMSRKNSRFSKSGKDFEATIINEDTKFVSALSSEAPNASVNTFSGTITIPPSSPETASVTIPLDAENMLLRGAVLRNTEWAIGVACFTGADTKLVRNSTKTPSKFSRLDELINQTVILILFLMLITVIFMGTLAGIRHNEDIDSLFYVGYSKSKDRMWPYLDNMDAPKWDTNPPNIAQWILTYITLLSNFVPLSLYITVEMTTLFMMVLIGWDKNMYHKETDTPAVARSTIATDLGQVKYIFSDKTGTLTQNVMRFKRCSVDGMIFGAPVEKSAPDLDDNSSLGKFSSLAFHPLKKLLVGSLTIDPNESVEVGLDEEGLPSFEKSLTGTFSGPEADTLTYNAEMFLRVMSLCHTVVVEKEIDASKIGGKEKDEDSVTTGSHGMKFWKKNKKKKLDTLEEADHSNSNELDFDDENPSYVNKALYGKSTSDLHESSDTIEGSQNGIRVGKGKDGSPIGFAYQAESPDEGALVSAASTEYGFQLISRSSNGVTISCESPSLLADPDVCEGLKSGSITSKMLASRTASPQIGTSPKMNNNNFNPISGRETWTILATNKFDSERKRMSVVVRSPPELGSIPILLCKGADSSMLDPEICKGDAVMSTKISENKRSFLSLDNENSILDESVDSPKVSPDEWEASTLLGIQAHLGAFATEGLRTLVLGVRILSEEQLDKWMKQYEDAASSLQDRDGLLKKAAYDIEKDIHIVGATAIEDKLQDGVPDTIYNIGRAGIKLWVLTGDKRETAIEIGYSTKVLDPKMHLADVADGPEKRVKALIAMEFMRLVKMGKLAEYQRAAVRENDSSCWAGFRNWLKCMGTGNRKFWRGYRRFYHNYIRTLCGFITKDEKALKKIDAEEAAEVDINIHRGKVRTMAENVLNEYLASDEGKIESERRRKQQKDGNEDDVMDGGMAVPNVFVRANSAMELQTSMEGELTASALRSLSIASMTSGGMKSNEDELPVIDEDALSMQSFAPGEAGDATKIFSKKKRTLLEKYFSVDRDVRKGHLVKHLTKEKKEEFYSSFKPLAQNSTLVDGIAMGMNADQDRALVIEGSALAHFLDDPYLEEMLFAVASNCESVIACRVSPKQKALLVNLVQNFVKPSPVTLAIGDGANDVGMIQEAHVGIGISGLEGQQAVNASDFSIAQFRFLEDLLMIHGRWNFTRMSKVVLFSFYKNAVLAGLMATFSSSNLFSGEPLFDMWALSAFNFVCGFPILFLGFFDRDLDREYVKRHPSLYAAGPNNEPLCLRVTLRWVVIVCLHVAIIYNTCTPAKGVGGSMTSAFRGLMGNEDTDTPGNGEGGDIKVFGTMVYTILNFTLVLKVLYESSSLIHGKWPAFTCKNDGKDGFWSRVAYTWHGAFWLSIGFNFFFLWIYERIGRSGYDNANMFPFVMVTYHTFQTRLMTIVYLFFVPVAAMSIDVIGKVFGNMFFPSQTQIHREIERKQLDEKAENLGMRGESETV